jgi:hypothetical protein
LERVLALRRRSADSERLTSSLSLNVPSARRRTYRLSVPVLINSRFDDERRDVDRLAVERFEVERFDEPRADADFRDDEDLLVLAMIWFSFCDEEYRFNKILRAGKMADRQSEIAAFAPTWPT